MFAHTRDVPNMFKGIFIGTCALSSFVNRNADVI